MTVSNRNGFPLLILTVFWKLFWIDRDTQREKEKIGLCGVKDNKRQGRTWHSYMSLSAAAQMLLPLLGVVWRFVQEKNCTITLSKTSSIMTCIIIIIIIYSIHSYHFYCLPCTCNKHFICISNLNMKHIIWAVYMCSRRYYKSLSKLSDNWPKLPRKMLIWLKMK